MQDGASHGESEHVQGVVEVFKTEPTTEDIHSTPLLRSVAQDRLRHTEEMPQRWDRDAKDIVFRNYDQ